MRLIDECGTKGNGLFESVMDMIWSLLKLKKKVSNNYNEGDNGIAGIFKFLIFLKLHWVRYKENSGIIWS